MARMSSMAESAAKVKLTADALLRRTSLIERLSVFGTVEITGSYEYNLMVDPDIDLIVHCDLIRESAVAACDAFMSSTEFSRVEFGDFLNFPREDRPQGGIVVLQIPEEAILWEIEVWFVSQTFLSNPELKKQLSHMSELQRESILHIKHERNKRGISKHQLPSARIYQCVIENSCDSIDRLLGDK